MFDANSPPTEVKLFSLSTLCILIEKYIDRERNNAIDIEFLKLVYNNLDSIQYGMDTDEKDIFITMIDNI